MRITRSRISQADIARMAGVTQPAVSLILGGKAVTIPEATRERVLVIARDLGYRADPVARRLATGRSQILGVFTYERIFSPAQRSLYHPFLIGVEEAAEETGHDLLLLTSAATPGAARSIHAGGEHKLRLVDAAVLLGRDEIQAELEELTTEGYPFVFIGRRFLPDGREVPNVAPDYTTATRELAVRIASAGHYQVAYVGTNPELPATAARLTGLRSGDLQVVPYFLKVKDVDEPLIAGIEGLGISAVVAENVVYAAGLKQAAQDHELSVPHDLSLLVAGVSEDDEAGAQWSGYRIPAREVGRLAVREVLRQLEGSPPRTRLVDCPAQQGATLRPIRASPE
jgi:DNA-binding LacI/PurR family transcriptional regulator